ncbi:MAG: hypothetical protein U5O39_19480 [Gammaproteobacteria bacterium]|nr:hypothetical protein [Gammaproteobacteria bacterium]
MAERGSTPTCATFYLDESRPLGVNNLVFENVGMPACLVGLQGVAAQVLRNPESGEQWW